MKRLLLTLPTSIPFSRKNTTRLCFHTQGNCWRFFEIPHKTVYSSGELTCWTWWRFSFFIDRRFSTDASMPAHPANAEDESCEGYHPDGRTVGAVCLPNSANQPPHAAPTKLDPQQ